MTPLQYSQPLLSEWDQKLKWTATMTKEGTIEWWSPEIRVKVVYFPALYEDYIPEKPY
jgi:hypothetical protein